jgi:DNA-binding LacI/PurR family transcriptional regulator
MHRASNDQYGTIKVALRELTKLGYKRIGMAMPAESDERVKRNWSAGMLVYQDQIPPEDRVPSLLSTASFSKAFAEWYQRHRPQAVLSLAWQVLAILHDLKLRVPEDVAFAHLALTASDRDSAGVNQNSELVGASALELVDAQLRRNERGVPEFWKTLLVPGHWVDGPTVRNLNA